MGGKTAMVTALNHPEVIERLVVVDVSPHKAPGGRESSDLINVLRNLDIMSLKNRREADAVLRKDVKVCCVITTRLGFFLIDMATIFYTRCLYRHF